eukprot:5755299-Alexandrium_andersonii.AAC.1
MSASLVGSEMCIRDRNPPTKRAGRRAGGAFSGGPGRRSPPVETYVHACVCLLYTSDAADDM